MATIHKDIHLAADADTVWDAVRDVGRVHERLCPGVLTDSRLDGDARVVTFADGFVARELIVDVDDDARRLAYAVVDGPLGSTHHSASAEVRDDGDGTRFVWITDVLPDSVAGHVEPMMTAGLGVIRATMEAASRPPEVG
jgi:hypothetical protein